MKMIFRIARMELQKMFYSPIAWLVLFIFAVQSGLKLMQMINGAVTGSQLGYATKALTIQIYNGNTGLFNIMQNNLYLYIPLLTMGMLSREFSSGSVKLLYSSPIFNRQIVLGKFLSMMIFGLGMVFILFVTTLLGAFTIKDFDFPMVLTAMLGLYLLICAYSAIGLYMSSLTSYQIVAAIGTFTTLFVFGQVGSVWQSIDFVRDITYWLSINGRSNTFIGGLICTEDVLYFILVSGLFIAFTIFRLKGIREKSPTYISFMRYAGTFMMVAIIGYISTIPSLMKYYDSTRTKLNTLTENSQEVISKLKGKIHITNYVNIFDASFIFGAPSAQKDDMSRYEKYRRFFPDMKIDYKYYYGLPMEEKRLASHKRRYAGLTEQQALEKAAESRDVSAKIFKPGTAFLDEINLEDELNRFVTKITTEDGKSSYLRTYNDIGRFPGESQITAAFKKLVTELPVVGFVKGQEERDINDFGSRGYFTLTKDKTFRYALINNGFDFVECELSKPVDKKISILVIADAKTALSAQEQKNLNDYIDRGGNLIIAGDLNRQDNMNPLVERLGVKFMPGQVVEYNKGYAMDMVTVEATKEGQKLTYLFEDIHGEKVVTMPGTVGISYEKKSGFTYTPLLFSDRIKGTYADFLKQPKTTPIRTTINTNVGVVHKIESGENKKQAKTNRVQMPMNTNVGVYKIESSEDKKQTVSWNELQTTDFIDNVPNYDPEKGETLGPLTTALALSRKVGEKEQRIMILGDADCFSNEELTANRNGIFAQNFAMATGMFFWMSNNQVPIDVRRPAPPDDKIYIKKTDITFISALYKIIIPGLLLLGFALLWFRRKGR